MLTNYFLGYADDTCGIRPTEVRSSEVDKKKEEIVKPTGRLLPHVLTKVEL